jgi:hypothetical protein
MVLASEKAAELVRATRDKALAFAEDVPHLRELLEKPDQTRGEIRRVSAVLRRLLVEDDLKGIAAPRNGRIELLAPDNNPAYKVIKPENTAFFLSAGAKVLGIELRAAMHAHPALKFENFDPDKRVKLSLDDFMKQRVLFWQGRWITRSAIIKYVANVAQGVHSGTARDADELIISDARKRMAIGFDKDGMLTILMAVEPQEVKEKPFELSASAIDLALLEIFSTVRFLIESPQVIELEGIIAKELI